jgi:hypothetical protein
MVLNSLEPDPVVDAIEAVPLAKETRDEIIIGEVCIETLPGG